jgi:NAD(P)-dependent dehydrogenase (short-subunit alcohol dehydrogenase family)
MDLGLRGKVVLVTGAASQIGFGRAIAVAFSREGCDLIIDDIEPEGLQKTAGEISALGGKVLAIKADVANEEEVKHLVTSGLAQFGRIDVLVNNAGTVFRSPFHLTTEKDWDINIGINLRGTWLCTRAVLPNMLERKAGKIINLSSVTGRTGVGTPLYAAAKAGVSALTKGLANEVGPSGINVNAIAPGMADTGFQIAAKAPPEAKVRFAQMVPMRRMNVPKDIADMALFLASDGASAITGQTFNVDCGSNMP